MRQGLRIVTFIVAAIVLMGDNAYPCGFEYSFRSYLDKRFWQPFALYERSLGRPAQKDNKACREAIVFAGTAAGGTPSLQRLRKAYRENDFTEARDSVESALQENPSGREREEILLIDAKVDMREAEQFPEKLQRSADKFISFIGSAQTPSLRSEARGWLARTYYLMGNYPSAVKIYLDEFSKEDTIFSRDSLITSLRLIFPYNGSSARLADHLDDYFDTPAHALFAITIVTNPVYFDDDERVLMAETAKKALDVLQRRSDLFGPGSETLSLALMRAALYMGDANAALAYSKRIPAESETANLPEFNWMKASSLFLRKDYAAAEAPLLKMYHSSQADSRDRNAAAQALTGVYQKLGRGVDQLHASFLADQRRGIDEERASVIFMYWPASGIGFDLSYLLDIQLTDEELREYLIKYSIPARSLVLERGAKKLSVHEIVQYALAVRYARQERYKEAAGIYDNIGHPSRSRRMVEISELYAKAIDPKLSRQQRLEAKYRYGSFLEKNSTRIFFNDTLWGGFQTTSFLGRGLIDFSIRYGNFPAEGDAQGLTKKERGLFLQQERKLKDSQEERWRAYKILVSVAEEAGRSELGLRAMRKALTALRRINTGRFGREDEINAADRRLERALALGYLLPPEKRKDQSAMK